MLSLSYNHRTFFLSNYYFQDCMEKHMYNFCWRTSGDLPAALTVDTATAISAADNGSKGWHLCALVIIGIPAFFCQEKQ